MRKYKKGDEVLIVKLLSENGKLMEDVGDYIKNTGVILHVHNNMTFYHYNIKLQNGTITNFNEKEVVKLEDTTKILFGNNNE